MKRIMIFVSFFALLLLIGFSVFYKYIIPKYVVTDVLYASVSKDSLMAESDLVFVGEVIDISETRWNQDNGRYWSDGLSYYTVTLSVIEPIVGEMKDEIVLTILENSPLDAFPAVVESDGHGAIPREHPLELGEKAVIFANQTEIAWRRPERVPAIVFNGEPRGATYLEGLDGRYQSQDGELFSLEELTTEIVRSRVNEN